MTEAQIAELRKWAKPWSEDDWRAVGAIPRLLDERERLLAALKNAREELVGERLEETWEQTVEMADAAIAFAEAEHLP